MAGSSKVQTVIGIRSIGSLQAGYSLKGYKEKRRIEDLNCLGKQNCVHVVTRDGYEFTVDLRHPVEIVDQGEFKEVLAKNLELGDKIPISLNDCGKFPADDENIRVKDLVEDELEEFVEDSLSNNLPHRVNEDLAFLIGFAQISLRLFIEGETTVTRLYFDNFTQMAREKIITQLKNYWGDLLQDSVAEEAEVKGYLELPESVVNWMKGIGLLGIKKSAKVPSFIFRASKKVMAAYLKGLFEARGTVTQAGNVYLEIFSEDFVKDIQLLLSCFGIASFWVGVEEDYQNRIKLILKGPRSKYNFYKNISFESLGRVKRLADYVALAESLGAIKTDYTTTEVVAIIPCVDTVYEVNVDGDHLFMIDGILTHNCQGSHLAAPFRELNQDLAVSGAKELIRNTGTKDVSPYA